MLPHGSDRVRVAGGKVLLFSRIPKGWQPRVPGANLRTEHPGTAVLWDDQYFEVIDAALMEGGDVRYVLAPWRDDHVIRDFKCYDDATEAELAADYEMAVRQRKHGKVVWLSGVVLGHLPEPVQNRLANEYGVSAGRMTLVSTIPSILLLGVCAWLYASARMNLEASPVPPWLWLVTAMMVIDSGVRYFVFMTQNRGMGSFPGAIVYAALSILAPKRFPWPRERGAEVFMLTPEEDVVLRDKIMMRAPLFTLLSPAEQRRLADRYGFDHRQHAYMPAVILLGGALLGVVSSFPKVIAGKFSALGSLIVAIVLAVEQIVRLVSFRRGPAGSVLAPLVRPFLRAWL